MVFTIMVGIAKVLFTVILCVALWSIGYTNFKKANAKTGVELLMDCIPHMEKVNIVEILNWAISLVLFDVPALVIHGIIEALHFLVVKGVNLTDDMSKKAKMQSTEDAKS